MKRVIDCLFIGHNEMDFRKYERMIRKMGVDSGAYRDLNLNFINYNGRPFTAAEIFNLFYPGDHCSSDSQKPLSAGETFSAAIAYLGTYLYRRGFTFDYVNSFQDEKLELKEKLIQENILTIAIVTTLYVSVFPIIEIIDFIKKYNNTAKIIIGGPFISTQVRNQDPQALQYLFKNTLNADIYVDSSQGEAALVNIIRSLKNDLPLDQINNIYYKSGGGYTAAAKVLEKNKLSDNLVDWELFSGKVGEYVNIRTAISCPFSCSFCGFPEHAGKYQTAAVWAVERELNLLDKIGSVKIANIIDDTFNVPEKRFKDILRMMVKNNYKFRWFSNFRCQFADREAVELMKEAGCVGVFLGLESGNEQILRNMNKVASVKKYLAGISLLKKYEIITFASFIIGFPGETEGTVKDTIKLIKESGIDFYRAQLWYCEPITPIWRQKKEYNLIGSQYEWVHKTMNSRAACDLVEEIFMNVDEPIWIPQYNFDFDKLFHLTNRGMSLKQVKTFLRTFSSGVKEKLMNPSSQHTSVSVVQQFRNSLRISNSPTSFDEGTARQGDMLKKFDAGFDF